MNNNIPALTIGQMKEVDRKMIEEFGVSVRMMMENASRHIATMARQMLGGSVNGKSIVVLAGKGNNGGDGLGGTRHLYNMGARAGILLATQPRSLTPDAKAQYDVLQNIGVNITEIVNISDIRTDIFDTADLIIDTLIGYNLKGDPREPIATLIREVNNSGKKILSIDMPSGLYGDSGDATIPTIKADTTLTLALPKVSLLKEHAKEYVGKLYLADLSVPRVLYKQMGLTVPNIFEKEEIINISHLAP